MATTPTMTMAFVTSNPSKVATAAEHLARFGVAVEQTALELEEIQSDSVQAVALHKAQQAFRALQRPLIIEDSGFYIDELNRFPGPLVKYVIKALGAEGVARLADPTPNRYCHFEGVLVYVDAHGKPQLFVDEGDTGTISHVPAAHPQPGSWSPLWDVFIPAGSTRPLSELHDDERSGVFDTWAKHSVFARFGDWFARERSA